MDAISHHAMDIHRTLWVSVLIISTVTTVQGIQDVYRCPEDLPRNPYLKTMPERNKCYQFIVSETYWEEAKSNCEQKGGNLLEIRDWETQHFIVNSWKSLGWRNNGIWLGATDSHKEYDWRWTTGGKVTWSRWGSGQPSCTFFSCHEDCAVIRSDYDYTWHDYNCALFLFQFRSVCQFEMGTATTPRPKPTPRPTTPRLTTKIPVVPSPQPVISTTTMSVPKTTTVIKNSTTTSDFATAGVSSKTTTGGQDGGHVYENLVSEDRTLSTGASVGIGFVILLALLILLLVGFLLAWRRRYRRKGEEFSIQSFSNFIYDISPGRGSNTPEPAVAFNNNTSTLEQQTERHYEDIDINPKNTKNCNLQEACAATYGISPKLVCELPCKDEFDTEDEDACGGACRGDGRHYDTVGNATSDETTEDEDNDKHRYAFSYMQNFLSKDSNSSKSYSNNLYDTHA